LPTSASRQTDADGFSDAGRFALEDAASAGYSPWRTGVASSRAVEGLLLRAACGVALSLTELLARMFWRNGQGSDGLTSFGLTMQSTEGS
jgi:hypothetical protein